VGYGFSGYVLLSVVVCAFRFIFGGTDHLCVGSENMSVANTNENLTILDSDCFCVYVCLQLLNASVWGERKAEAKVCIKCCFG